MNQAQQTFELALQWYQSGRLLEAEAIFHRVLAEHPDHAGALRQLGIIAHQTGRRELGLERLEQAITLAPHDATSFFALGNTYGSLNRWQEAIDAYLHSLQLKPDSPEVLNSLGLAFQHEGRSRESVQSFEQAIHLCPSFAEAHYNLSVLLMNLGYLEKAAAHCEMATQLRPEHAATWNILGIVYIRQGFNELAISTFRHGLAVAPGNAELHTSLGNILKHTNQLDAAVESYQRALFNTPHYALAHYNLGRVFQLQERYDEALAELQLASQLAPDWADPQNSLGCVLAEIGRFDEAVRMFRHALSLEPDFPNAKFNLAVTLLLLGNFSEGWLAYEARLPLLGLQSATSHLPRWDGNTCAGRRILVHAEQGFGDAINFIRYAPLIVRLGLTVIVQCPSSLVVLFRSIAEVNEVIPAGELRTICDAQIPLLSLPLIFQTNAHNIPRETPYLFADPERRKAWQDRIPAKGTRLRVGFVFSGDTSNPLLKKRKIELNRWKTLFTVREADFFSLQVDDHAEDVRQLEDTANVFDYSQHIRDFAETAALIEQLDLIISVDTAVAHLAGALGRPVWTLLPFVPDWRWGLNTETTPWYPTMRLFRQPALGDWDSVIQRVAKELQHAITDRAKLLP